MGAHEQQPHQNVRGLLEKVTVWEEDGVDGAGKEQTVKS